MRRSSVFLLVPLLLAGCTSAPSAEPAATGKPSELTGVFFVDHGTVSADLEPLAQQLEDDEVAENAVALINERVRMPSDVTIEVHSCSEGSGYDPEKRAIEICLEEVAEVQELLEDAKTDDVSTELENLLTETITHEAGHALIDLNQLPYTGRQETVADQFSAYVLIGGEGDEGLDVLESTAYGYELSADAFEALTSDEHESDAQRAVNFQCWVYGADRRDSEHLVSKDGLTEERAEYCNEEWDALRDGWNALLEDAGALRTPVA